MDETALRQLMASVAEGTVTVDDAVAKLRRLPFANLGFALVDHHRHLRTRLPEAVYAPGKTPRQCALIVEELLAGPGGPVLLTRARRDQVVETLKLNPQGLATPTLPPGCIELGPPRNHPTAYPGPKSTRESELEAFLADPHSETASAEDVFYTLTWRHEPPRQAKVLVITAGTADLPVAQECTATLIALGFIPTMLADRGVAGLHRLLYSLEDLYAAEAVVVIAGMEGALASLVGGITAAPVVAVPTSVGYGASLNGVTALLAMLASCAPGVSVVGIDNGYGAACAVARTLL
ncbi:MAG: nickel pincer cofactor biosynthesis protein LarB [Actinobacteria bacterium]|nr:nickel pincer cofactor biosynthesis protein LarB [Actinomycetota bacterium]